MAGPPARRAATAAIWSSSISRIAVGGHGDHVGIDAAREIGTAGGGVLLGGGDQRLDREPQASLVRSRSGRVRRSSGTTWPPAAGARRGVVLLLVAATDDVEACRACPTCSRSSKPQNSGTTTRPWKASGEIAAHHAGQIVGLAFEAQPGAFDLLVVLEFGLEQLDQLDGHAGGAGDGDRRDTRRPQRPSGPACGR